MPTPRLECAAEPLAPNPDTATAGDLKTWIEAALAAGEDCRKKLEQVK